MNPAWAASASDAVLAAVAIWVCVRFSALTRLPQSQRWLAAIGTALIASAAVLGCLRFAGLEDLRTPHTLLSNQAAIISLPMILVALAWSWVDDRIPHRALTIAAAVLLIILLWIQMRPASGAVSFLLVLATLAKSRHQRLIPVLMLAAMAALAWLAGTQLLGTDGRLILLHAVLAVLLPLTLRAFPRTAGRRA